ncbi:MAG: hypothetical protein ACRBB3_06850 [Alphaproteobacteria bacterium]
MVDPNNNFEEFEFDDEDIDDSWDDALEEDISSDDIDIEQDTEETLAKTSTAKPMIKLVLLSSVLIGASFGIYSYTAISDQDKNIPIVKINKTSVMNAEVTTPKENKVVDIITMPAPVNPADTAIISKRSISQDTILTPMPDGQATNIVLSKLDNELESPDEVSDNITFDYDTIKSMPLSEDELLSKTEASFQEENANISDIENADNITEETIELIPKKPEEELTSDSKPIELESLETQNDIIIKEANEHIVLPSTKPSPPIKEKAIISDNVSNQAKKTKQKQISWTIRAAQPGKAVVYDKINKVMRSIEVNNTLPGIGRIKSIKLKNGRWVITGTKGNILQ